MLPLLLSPTLLSTWTLAIGSCHHQEIAAPALLSAAESKPDAFAFLGDNLYNDIDAGGMPCEPIDCRNRGNKLLPKLYGRLLGKLFGILSKAFPAWAEQKAASVVRAHNARSGPRDMEALAMAYATLSRKPELAKLRAAVPKNIIATWDDHDYCRNDAGSSCKWANESQRQFLQFWRSGDGAGGGGGGGGDAVAARGGRLGVYEAYTYNVPPRERCRSPPCRRGSVVRVLMLDTRTWRSDHRLRPLPGENATSDDCTRSGGSGYCQQQQSSSDGGDVTILGDEQWRWLEGELKKPADVRIIATSISFGAQFNPNGDETWAVFPFEKRKMLRLITSTNASGVVFVSGDLHYAEINEINASEGAPYTLHDLCSSGLTMTWPSTAPNMHRVAGPVREANWGSVTIDFEADDPTIDLSVHDGKTGVSKVGLSLKLSSLRAEAA